MYVNMSVDFFEEKVTIKNVTLLILGRWSLQLAGGVAYLVWVFEIYTYTHTRISIHIYLYISLCICIHTNVCEQTVTTTHFSFFFGGGWSGQLAECVLYRMWVFRKYIYTHTHVCIYIYLSIYFYVHVYTQISVSRQ